MRIGRKLRGGEIIELVGDLGAGKTTFVRGLVQGTDSRDTVRSPSFTLSNVYEAGQFTVHHFDFYRLDEPDMVMRELAEILDDPKAVVVVEWGGIARAVLPPDRLTVHIRPTSETGRSMEFSCPKKFAYLIQEQDR